MNGLYGSAATGLQDSSWAVNQNVARVGAAGEKKSAALLDGFHLKAAVMHDLRVPIPGFKANIDHVIVYGKNVFILDTKVWKPGFYWTLDGTTRRGLEKVKHIDKQGNLINWSRRRDSNYISNDRESRFFACRRLEVHDQRNQGGWWPGTEDEWATLPLELIRDWTTRMRFWRYLMAV